MTDLVRSTSSFAAFKEAYFNPQAFAMLFLGFAAGVPILLIFSSLGLWLREAGIDRSTVTMFSWAALGYSFKFIWSPLVDVLPVPVLNKWLGQRRAWLLLTQIGIIGAIVLMASVDPAQSRLSIMALGAVLLGFSAATQDIVIDAYRIESAPSQMQTALSATYVGGYRIGMIVSGAGALYLADFFGSSEAAYSYTAWQKTYLIMAAVMLIAVATTLFIREPKYAAKKEHMNSTPDNLRLLVVFALSVIGFIFTYVQVGSVLPETDSVGLGFLYGVVRFISSGIVMGLIGYALVQVGLVAKSVAARAWVMPIRDFFERYGKKALLVLALIGLYRISDIVAGNISNIFYQDIGFTKTQIANAVKVVGVIASIGGGFVGGWIAQKTGVMRAMMIGALLACVTNLLFILLFYTPTSFMMYLAVITDNLAAGLASAVFIAFLSALTSIRFTAVQYALFSSLMTLSPKILGGYSGAIVDATNYSVFFAITFVIGIPILLLVYLVNKYIAIEEPVIKK
ncbi:AmpG family muropeptide MFS transporter [Moraxella ovis]|uniref:AmpG family muropeptide MFS transporter n=1 Tax=Moraxella ovis TaxID=29433 RepID=UPI000D8E2FB6|nr:MFS transporter [Moraxella ovis]SPX85162.1 muropeptide transporter [Moraxella ovis]STZ05140.1 muropeptide transporter [Moraxella ovis]